MCNVKQCIAKRFALKSLREEAIARLLSSPFLSKNAPYARKNAILDVDVLLCFVLKKTKAQLLAHLDDAAYEIQDEVYRLIEKRYQGIAIAYIVEEKEFFSLSFYVNHSVLIPKSDTELLVEKALDTIDSLMCKQECYVLNCGDSDDVRELSMLDVFSGSGCVGISTVYALCQKFENMNCRKTSLLGHSDNCRLNIYCSFLDVSSEAIETSRINAQKLLPFAMQDEIYVVNPFSLKTSVPTVIQTFLSFFCQDATYGFPLNYGKQYDMIMANPPYVPRVDTEKLLSDGRGEPTLALDGGEDGMMFFESLARNAYATLKNGGVLLCEVGDGQAQNVALIFAKAGFANIECHQDLSQKDRVVKAEKT